MKTKTRTIIKTSLATSLAVVATGSAGAMAAAPYTFVGSDTLTEVVRDSITQAGLSSSLVYNNTGSGAAENALQASPPTQRIAPMSRNFKSGVLSAHPNWAPQLQNIIGLDAAVIVELAAGAGYSACPNLNAALDPSAPGKAVVDSMIGLILGGKGGVGDTAACSHPDRLAAIDALAGCFNNVPYITHFYRRDDRSGTADTMKERFRIQRFCNGRAPGLVNNQDNNLANDDADPVRRECVPAASGLYAATKCTLWPSNTDCTNTPTAAGCTQGLVVALSQNDPGKADITTSIAQRVASSPTFSVVGFAGREASRQPGLTAPKINTISPNNFNVRTSSYIAARRLFVNWSDQVVGFGRSGGPNADERAQEAAEEALYNWMTDPVVGGRFNVDPILVAHGFLPCTDDYSDPSGPSNLCSSEVPPPAAETTPAQCIPAGVSGNGTNVCCATGTASTNGVACPAYSCRPANYACAGSGQGTCCAGLTCTDQGTGNFACN